MPGTEFKNQVDNLMNILFGAGVASHATIIEQINYLVFLRSLSKKDDSAMILDSSAEKIFSGELAKYHWNNLLVLNAEVLFTTLEEIFRKLPELATDQTIRLLFRDAHVKIFDKPTLRRLVHEIVNMMSELEEEASSGHTDIFGDMYEYLLSKLSQSGTLGSFRTPRHIVKFIVDIVDPSKGETVLDPACGTAGFLVTAYEHLKEKYTSEELKIEGRLVMDKITPEERKFISQHTFTGFDSDSDMFKFGLMNLYLHKLEHPNIKRQNTLVDTAGDRTKWDIILANPPFAGALDQDSVSEDLRMNTRATEVLFLKYIVDHLSQNGRAGVIVPEGVVFSSTTAHKKIRQILVEDAGLWCVVSLPSGVFNPYAGVKTSILFFDKSKKDNYDEILFVKVENDGFDLGAQRKSLDKNDLPDTLKIINIWKKSQKVESKKAIYVNTDKINQGNGYILMGERYVTNIVSTGKWEELSLPEVFTEIKNGKNVQQTDETGKYRVSRIQTIADGTVNLEKTKWTNDEVLDKDFLQEGDILLSHINSIEHLAKTAIFTGISEKVVHGINLLKLRPDRTKVIPEYASHILKSDSFINIARSFAQRAVNQASINTASLKTIKIPVPPLAIQKQIVAVLDSYQNIIGAAKQIVSSWKPKIDIGTKWEIKKLVDIAEVTSSKRIFQNEYVPEGIPFYRTKEIVEMYLGKQITIDLYISRNKYQEISKKYDVPKQGDILVSAVGTIGYSWVVPDNREFYFKDGNLLWLKNIRADSNFIQLVIDSLFRTINELTVGGAYKALTIIKLKQVDIPLPPIEIQKQIVEKIEAERKLVEGNKKLIEIYQLKIKEKIERLWTEN
mgnify:CR=1 FL=1